VANLVEDVVTETGQAKAAGHEWKLALIPALRDAGGDVEGRAGDSEEILAISDAGRNVMRKVARLSSDTSILFAGRIPYKWRSSVVGTSSVVMVQDSVLVVDSRRQGCLRRAAHVTRSNLRRGSG